MLFRCFITGPEKCTTWARRGRILRSLELALLCGESPVCLRDVPGPGTTAPGNTQG